MSGEKIIKICTVLFILYPAEIFCQNIAQTGNLSRLAVNRTLFHPASMIAIEGKYMDVYYSRPYGMKELETVHGFGSFVWKRTANGISIMSFGKGVYTETESSIYNTLRITNNIGICSDLSFLLADIKNYKNIRSISYSGGFFIYSGWSAVSIIARNIAIASDNQLESILKGIQIAGNFRLSENLTILTGFLKEENRDPSFSIEGRAGLLRYLLIAAGFGTNPDEYTAGAEIMKKNMNFSYYYRRHTDLGGTFELGISITIK
ncbi:hypothetical protein ACFL6G_04220 [candidate division KSB1 bacterium]